MIRVDNLMDYTRDQLKRMRTNLTPATRPGKVKAIHRFRVASRRLKEPLELLAPWMPSRKLKTTLKDLKMMRRTFQRVRDLDVLLIHLGQAGTREILDPSDLAYVEGQLTAQRSKALQKAARRTEKKDLASRLKSIARVLDGVEKDIKDERIAHEPLSEMLQTRARELLNEAPGDHESDLHDIRIRLKRLRYTAELSERLTAHDSGDLIHATRKLQDVLGEWNDFLVAVDILGDLARNRELLARQTERATRVLKYVASWSEAAEQQRLTVLQRWPQLEQWIRTSITGVTEEASEPTPMPSTPIPPVEQD